jgi:hypothetical protein
VTDWNGIITAGISALTGGGLIKGMEVWLNKKKNSFDQNKAFRDEYRGDIKDLRIEISAIKNEHLVEKKAREKAEDKADWWKDYAQALVMQFRFFQLDMKEVLKSNGIVIPEDKFTPLDFPAKTPFDSND